MNWVRFPRGPPLYCQEENMEDDLIETLKQIHKIAEDETFSSEEALDIIMELVEVTLSHHGSSLDDDEEEE